MSGFLTQSCLRQLTRGPLRQGSLPIFLAPAFSQLPRTQSFSTTSPTQSRVGAAAIAIPPEVSLKFIDLPQVAVRGVAKDIPTTKVEIKGPLGKPKPTTGETHAVLGYTPPRRSVASTNIWDLLITGELSLTPPSFLTINHDEAARKASLSVVDGTVAHQRAMWGMYLPSDTVLFHTRDRRNVSNRRDCTV